MKVCISVFSFWLSICFLLYWSQHVYHSLLVSQIHGGKIQAVISDLSEHIKNSLWCGPHCSSAPLERRVQDGGCFFCLLTFWLPPLIQTALLCVISQNCTHSSTCHLIKISLMCVNTNLYKLQIFGPFYDITDNQRLITSSSLRTSCGGWTIKGFLLKRIFVCAFAVSFTLLRRWLGICFQESRIIW